jgi:hypothetical protein
MPPNAVTLWLTSILSSYCCDFIIRNKITNHMNFFYMNTLPIPRLMDDRIISRAARLICTSSDFGGLWADTFQAEWKSREFWYPPRIDSIASYGPQHEQDIRRHLAEESANLTPEWIPACGVHDRITDRRDTGERAQLRAEIDAHVAHLYGLCHDEFAYILDTFPVLKRKEEQAFGEFISKRKCLEEFDRISGMDFLKGGSDD